MYRIVIAAAFLALGTPTAATAHPTDVIDFHRRLQPIDGFGFSMAFQRANILNGFVPPDQTVGLTPEHTAEMVDLMFNRRTGMGLSILRLGIGSSPDDPYDLMKSIQPVDPGGPDAPPRYVWDGDDGGQVWLAKQARAYGVQRFYADAWSPPGYMKTNGTDNNGGQLCGLPDTACASGDWRQAYANYLVQYVRFYAREGIRITDLGFTNEPDLTVSYASMQITPAQVVDFLKVLGPTVHRSRLPLNIACCDAAGWDEQAAYTAAIEADPAADRWVDVHTGHPYRNPADTPLPTRNRVWMSEWQPNGTAWTEAWDDATTWNGITVAENIHDTLTLANASAYVYWFAASRGTTRAFMQFDGANYHVAKRLYAMAAFSRYIRPGAVRVAARTGAPSVKVSAFRNADGTEVVELLNTGTSEVATNYTVKGAHGRASSYLTDEAHSLESTGTARLRGRQLSVSLPPRSLTTVVLR
jgi:glucosylceramidase